MQSLLQYADAHEGEPIADVCYAAVLAHVKEAYRRQQTATFTSWSQNRWQDWVLLLHWLWDKAPQGQEAMASAWRIERMAPLSRGVDLRRFAREPWLRLAPATLSPPPLPFASPCP